MILHDLERISIELLRTTIASNNFGNVYKIDMESENVKNILES